MKEEKHVCNGIIKLSPFHLIEEVLGKLRTKGTKLSGTRDTTLLLERRYTDMRA